MFQNFTTKDEESISPIGFTLKSIQMTTNSGFTFDLRDLVHQIKIIENLNMKSIMVLIFIEDGINLGSEIKLAGNENIKISLERLEPGGIEKFLDLNLQIAQITNYSEPTPSSQAYTLLCVSNHSYLNNKKLLNRPFKGLASDLIEDIVKSDLKSTLDKKDSTKGIMEGIYPNLKPYDAIQWLMRNAHRDNGPMFFYETAKDGLVFTSYFDLLSSKDEPFNIYNKDPFFQFSLDGKDPDEIFIEEKLKFRSINTSMDTSKLNSANNGMFGSVLNTIDISTKTIDKHEFSWKDEPLTNYLNKFSALDKKMEILDTDSSFFDLNKSKQYYQSINKNAFDEQPNYHANTAGNGLLKAYTAGELLNSFSFEADLVGDFDMTPGNIIGFDAIKHANIVDEMTDDQDPSDFEDEYMSGLYLVHGVEHTFNKDGYIMKIKAMKDSLISSPIDDFNPKKPNSGGLF